MFRAETRNIRINRWSMIYQLLLTLSTVIPLFILIINDISKHLSLLHETDPNATFGSELKKAFEKDVEKDGLAMAIGELFAPFLLPISATIGSTFLVKKKFIQQVEIDPEAVADARVDASTCMSYFLAYGVSAGGVSEAMALMLYGGKYIPSDLTTTLPGMNVDAAKASIVLFLGILGYTASVLPAVAITNSIYNKRFTLFGVRPDSQVDENAALSATAQANYGTSSLARVDV